MTIWRLIFREIRMRRLGFGLAVAAVAAAVTVVGAAHGILGAYDRETEQLLDKQRARIEEEMRVMEDDYRKIMKKLGFNLLILPEGQKLGDYYAEGYAALDMPEENVTKLANSGIMTVRHLAPTLERKVRWPEQGGRSVILIGARGEVPLAHRSPLEPILLAVEPGDAALGFELWDGLGLEVGDTIRFMGREFRVSQCNAERGTKDDISMWVDLPAAQAILDKPGRINGIFALKCLCAGNELALIRAEIAQTLPGTTVVEFAGSVVTRAEARARARVTAIKALEDEEHRRSEIRLSLAGLVAWLIPAILLGAAFWVALLAWINVRERRNEIGILRALGLGGGGVLTLVLTRAALIGLLGAGIGMGLGYLVTLNAAWGRSLAPAEMNGLFQWDYWIGLFLLAPVVTMTACWPPALRALGQDPASILREE